MFQRDLSFVHKYFMGEKQESIVFLAIGSAAVILSIIFFFVIKSNPSFYKGAAIPLLLIGLILAAVGFTIYNRSDKQRLDVSYNMGIDPGYVKQKELPRMKKVMTSFVIYRYTEIFLVIAGIALFIFLRKNNQQQFLAGLGLTLALMALAALVADYFAHNRGGIYTKELENFISSK